VTNVETPQWVAGSKSREIFDEEQLHLAPGAQSFALFSKICIDRGEGALLYDVDGNRFIDLMAGIGVASLGYAHPKYVAALQKQVAKIHVGSFTSENRAAKAARNSASKASAVMSAGTSARRRALFPTIECCHCD